MYGARAVLDLFENISHSQLRGHLIWTPVLDQDDYVSAETLAQTVQDSRISTYWDEEHTFGLALRDALKLTTFIAWDIYLLYPPETSWPQGSNPPLPSLWMHQMSDEPMTNWLDAAQLTARTQGMLEQNT